MRATVSIALFASITCAAAGSRAQNLSGTTTSATLEVAGDDGAQQMPLVSESLTVVIENQHSETTLRQSYHNRAAGRVEGRYLLDAGPDARVSGFTYWNGEQAIVGRVIEKTAGRAVYDEVTGLNRDPGLLEQIGDGKFSLRVFPIEGGENKKIEIEYTRWLRRVANTITYRAPVRHDAAAVDIAIRDQQPIGAIRSSTHDLDVERGGDGTVRVVARRRAGSKRDELILRYDVVEPAWTVNALAYRPDKGDGYFTASLAAPRLGAAAVAPKDVTLVLDISGSMAGEPLARARDAAVSIIGRIGGADRVNVIAFDDDADRLFARPAPAHDAVKKQAIDYVRGLRSRGGTDIAGALGAAMAAQAGDARPKVVLFLTDGNSDAGAAIAAARADRRNIRVFTVGLGDVDKALLSRLAAVKRGRFVHIHRASGLERAMSAVYSQISKPLLVDVSVEIAAADGSDAVIASRVYPRSIPDLFADDQLVISGRLRSKAAAAITIRGTLDGRRVAYRAALETPSRPQSWIAKLWAISRIEHLVEEISINGETAELKREATDLALAYNLVTRYTSFLAIPASEITANARKILDAAETRRAAAASRYTSQSGGEHIVISGNAPTIDTTSTRQGITIDREYMSSVPIRGRGFEDALTAAAGAQSDALGVSFSGSTSLENEYVIDGVNTTGLTYGTLGSPLIREFISEIEVVTGGHNAEYGRATGGNVHIATETGSNEFHGSLFSTFSNGLLTAARERSPTQASSIDAETNTAYDATFGFKLGGPIIEDKMWFFVGLAPRLIGDDITKITKRRTDCRRLMPDGSLSTPADQRCSREDAAAFGDGVADEDPETGFLIYEDLSRSTQRAAAQEYQFLAKVNAAPSPEHQGQVSFSGTPFNREVQGVGGDPVAISRQTAVMTTDLSLKWTSKFNDSKTELTATAGWHRSKIDSRAADPLGDATPRQNLFFGDLGTWSALGFEDGATRAGCADSADAALDPYPLIANCPDNGAGYRIGGVGDILDDLESRVSARLVGRHYVKAAGVHELKAGVDIEDNSLNRRRVISGGTVLDNLLGREIRGRTWVKLAPPGAADPSFDQSCGADPGDPLGAEQRACDFIEPGDPDSAADVDGNTVNWATFVQDSWQILPNLTLNVGLRYEEQRLRYSRDLRGSLDPFTGERLGDNAMVMRGMWAPRLGAVYDWTKEGRSKVYGFLGRFYESIPMNINDRSFGGETQLTRVWDPSQCGAVVDEIGGQDATMCLGVDPQQEQLFGSGVLVAPGIKPQYVDEAILGVEYEILEDTTMGLSVRHRALGRVIEDVSVDNADTYILANPGELDDRAERELQAEIDSLAQGDPERERLEAQLAQFRSIELFDRPRRDHTAVTVTASRRFSRSLFVQGSYTHARTRGNFPGLFSADNNQVDPNITSQYDLIELLANRDGPLPQDQPHQLKLDGYYNWRVGDLSQLTPGLRFRAASGIPKNTLARHYLYGVNESFLLPRGAMGRTDTNVALDLHLGFARDIADGVRLELYADLFSIFNTQGTFSIDRAYTFDSANPVVGGDYRDLIWIKALDSSGLETADPVSRNPNFGNTAARYAPLSGRLGARVSF
jgi:hypothetical protein